MKTNLNCVFSFLVYKKHSRITSQNINYIKRKFEREMPKESISVSPASSFLAAWLCPVARSKRPAHNTATKQTDAPLGLRS